MVDLSGLAAQLLHMVHVGAAQYKWFSEKPTGFAAQPCTLNHGAGQYASQGWNCVLGGYPPGSHNLYPGVMRTSEYYQALWAGKPVPGEDDYA